MMDFGPEWAVLELIARHPVGEAVEELDRLLAEPALHWGELLEQAIRHKLAPALAVRVVGPPLKARVPRFIWFHLQSVHGVNVRRTELFRAAAAEISTALGGAGVTFAGTKGIALESTVYRGDGSRYMNDLDLMVLPEQRDTAMATLRGSGFEAGELDRVRGRIVPYDRRTLVTYQLNPDHLPVMARLTGDPVFPAVRVDVALSLTWAHAPFAVPVAEALRDREPLTLPGHPDAPVPTFTPGYQFLFTVLHLFREAWIDKWLTEEQDVNLAKFADVLRLWWRDEKTLRTPEFRGLLDRYQIAEPVAWVLVHLDRVMGTDLAGVLQLTDRVDEDYLASAQAPGGGTRTWRGGMRHRLWSKNRRALFDRPATATGAAPSSRAR
jgi:Uncharacterised nucleotidyltransferase